MGEGFSFFSTLENRFSGIFKTINHEWSSSARVIDKTSSINVKTVSHKAKSYQSPITRFSQTGSEWIHLYEDTATKQTENFRKEY